MTTSLSIGASRAAWWHRLPREARDTLFQLGVIAWVVLPHSSHLPPWCTALTALVLGWRARLAAIGAPLPGRWPTAGVLIVAVSLTAMTERTLLGREAGVTLLVVLLALKTLELRARRDALVVFFLGFFLVLTHFLYSQSVFVAGAMLVAVWGLLTALVLAHMPVGRPPLWLAAGIALRLSALGLPVMLALFMLFPRFGPLWGMPQDALGRTGLSGTLRMGGVAAIANDDSIAFRIRFEGPTPPAETLYFRGPVLSVFDGIEWRRAGASLSGEPRARNDLRLLGPPLRYEMTLEPIRLPMLPLLEATPDRQDTGPQVEGFALSLRPDLEWLTDRLVTERVKLVASAWLRFEHGPRQIDERVLREALGLPAGRHPRLRQWATDLRARLGTRVDGRVLATELMRHIREGGYTYTLAPGEYGGDALDEFWLDRKEGFCEHFSAGFVVAMRMMGVPARIVTGYQGAEPRDRDGWHVVRQSHAHAWAEYWLAGVGWVRADPTAAVAPERVRASRPLLPQPGLVAGALNSMNPEMALQIKRMLELLDNRWNQWVLNYSRQQQFDLLRSLGIRQPEWGDLGLAIAGLLTLAASAGAAWAWWDRRRQDPWARLHGRLLLALRRVGVPAQPHWPPLTMAHEVRQRLGPTGAPLATLLVDLDRLRHGPGGARMPPAAWWAGFKQAAAVLPRHLPPGQQRRWRTAIAS
ncbi:MAG: transglutaminaseTgpA domain-containing protein [Aquabacterium sp.]